MHDARLQKGFATLRFGVVFSQNQYSWTSKERNHIKVEPYAFAMGSLIYTILCARLNICFTIGIVSRY